MRRIISLLLIVIVLQCFLSLPVVAAKNVQQSQQPAVIKIPAGTVVELETAYRISSQEFKAGDAITFHVINPVKVGDTIVIEVGAVATGRVTKATRGGHFGKAGRLAWIMENVTAIDGSRVPIQAAGRIVGDSKAAKVATQMAVTGVFLGPFAPAVLLFGFKRGKNAYIAQGKRYDVTVTQETTVKARD